MPPLGSYRLKPFLTQLREYSLVPHDHKLRVRMTVRGFGPSTLLDPADLGPGGLVAERPESIGQALRRLGPPKVQGPVLLYLGRQEAVPHGPPDADRDNGGGKDLCGIFLQHRRHKGASFDSVLEWHGRHPRYTTVIWTRA